jgi:3-hydroxybutyryl-CoA dehydratase
MATDAWLDGTANWNTPSNWSAGALGSTRICPTSSSVRAPLGGTQVMYFEDLAINMSAAVSKLITERDVETFAAVSTDTNPIHLSDEFAAGTRFKRRIAHGLLIASLISAALGTKLPGPGAIYVSQNLTFTAPVYLGDIVTATVTLVTLDSLRRRARFDCACHVGHKMVLSGDAVLYVPNRPVELAA